MENGSSSIGSGGGGQALSVKTSGALIVSTVLLLTWLATKLVLRYFFTSSSKALRYAPGPQGVPVFGALLHIGTRPHRSLTHLAKTYGPIMFMRWGCRPTLVVSNPEMAKEILKTHDQYMADRPSLEIGNYIFWSRSGFGFSDFGPRQKSLRKFCIQHLLTIPRVKHFQDVRRRELMQMLYAIFEDATAEPDKEMIVGNYLANMSSNNMTMMMWNKRHCGLNGVSSFDEEEALTFHSILREVFDLFGGINIGDFIPALRVVSMKWLGMEKRMKAVRSRMDSFLDNIIKEKEKLSTGQTKVETSGPEDLLTLMLRYSKEAGVFDEPLTKESIKGAILDLILAGTDTTATTLEWAMAEMMQHPNKLKKLKDEISSVVGSDRLVDDDDVPKMPYLQAVMQETLRMHQPAPLAAPHSANEARVVAGYDVPKGTIVFVNMFAIHRDPTLWTNPEEFTPERFLESPDFLEEKTRALEMLPFSSGRRMCPGMSLALASMHVPLANMFHVFDWRLPAGMKREDMDMRDKYSIICPLNTPLALLAKPKLARNVIYSEAVRQ